jgi:acetyltransferase-like isoleucine patch superfamily enzyme
MRSNEASAPRAATYRYPRKLAVWAIAFMPGNSLRTSLYRIVCRYRIAHGARIGFGSIIAVDKAEIDDATIGRFNRFQGPYTLRIQDGSKIGDRNSFDCGVWSLAEPVPVSSHCYLGANTLITGNHYIDVTKGFVLGDRSWIAGRDTQIWTHGAGVEDGEVRVGNDCYIGSAARFAPGSGVGDRCIVAMGAVLTQYIEGTSLLVGGVPARVIRERTEATETALPDNGS